MNRPARRNSLTPKLIKEMTAGLQELTEDPSVRCILLRGVGGFLCAGLDVEELQRLRKEGHGDGGFRTNWSEFHVAMFRCPKPTVCVLEGVAITVGSALALAADYLIVQDDARFHVAEVNFGMAAPLNLLWLAFRHGEGKAVEFVVGGQPYAGADLVRKGLATAGAATGPEALALGRAWASKLAKNDAKAVALSKEMVRHLAARRGFDFETEMKALFELTAASNAGTSALPSTLAKAKALAAPKL